VTSGERHSAGVEAFGRWLLRERELRGLAREEVAHATKLAPGVIEALESGDGARMPPRAYVVGYLRSYASAVGLDPDETVLRWQELEGASGPEAPPRAPRRRGRAVLVAILVVALAAALVALALAGRGSPGPGERVHRPSERGSYRSPEPEPGTR
jgi:cytoskeletal protein RodZ